MKVAETLLRSCLILCIIPLTIWTVADQFAVNCKNVVECYNKCQLNIAETLLKSCWISAIIQLTICWTVSEQFAENC